MKLWGYIFGVTLITLFTFFSLANDEMVMVSSPNFLGASSGKSIYLPIYLIIALAIFVGIIIGVLIEYLRNFKLRRAFNENNKKLLKVEKELKKSKEKFLTEEEKIFNLLD